MLTVFDAPADLRSWSESHRADTTIAMVPTMGSLHRGHHELIRVGAERGGLVIVSIFVNPLQFGESADFDRYPRALDDDLAACESAGVDVVYAPTVAAMYPAGFSTGVSVTRMVDTMEGAARPGHFDGVTTVVAKLLNAGRPHVTVFGEKDFQQLSIVRRMVSDLDLGIEVVAVPTVREPDGLALSSRNRRLSDRQRSAATCIPRALDAAVRATSAGAAASAVSAAAAAVIDAEPLAVRDYVTVFDGDTLQPFENAEHELRSRHARIAIAARFGDVRLIDNVDLDMGPVRIAGR